MLTVLIPMIRDEEGATMTEYGVLIMLIALVAFSGVQLFGINVAQLFTGFGVVIGGTTTH